MSLDVYLYSKSFRKRVPASGIFIREDGQNKEITLEEWNARFPDRQAVIVRQKDEETNCVYSHNITHNLGLMAKEAGVYQHLWRPEELSIEVAGDLIIPLQNALEKLTSDPAHFQTFNPANGWGSYEGLVEFVTQYLQACRDNPDATITVSR